MAKQDFDAMLGLITAPAPAAPEAGEAATAGADDNTPHGEQAAAAPVKPAAPQIPRRQSRPASRSAAAPRPAPRQQAPVADSDPARWTDFEPKTTRLRPDQRTALNQVARRLTVAKAGAGERITDNTLIRVAIDLLLEREHAITGTTEAEIRAAVGLKSTTS